jgi:hypothetical protein
VSTTRNVFRIGGRAFAVATIVRQLRQAQQDGDKLKVLDAVVNGLAILTALAILVREIREHAGDGAQALEDAPL